MQNQAFPLIDVEGDARERGRQHGAKAAERIHRSIEIYIGALDRYKFGRAEFQSLTAELADRMTAYDAEQVEEMRGMAEGAKVPFEHIILCNGRSELLGLAKRQQDGLPDACTAAVVLPEASADGVLMHGQNWDGMYEQADVCIVLRIRREDGPDILTFTEAGQMARNGFNTAGIAITGNNLESERDYLKIGVPLPMVRRKALATPHYAHAIMHVYGTPKSGSNNMTLSHIEGETIDIECAPDESFVLHPENGLMVHANHWENPSARARLIDRVAIESAARILTPDSFYRSNRVRKFLTPKVGKITFDDFKQAFMDKFGEPYSVLRSVLPNAAEGGTICTTATIVMRPAEGIMEVARLTAQNPHFTRYTLAPKSERAAA